MTNDDASLDRVFGALSDPTRRAIVSRLAKGPASVSELAQPHRMALPTFLQHLRVLEKSRLIRSRKQGRVRTCEADGGALQRVEDWLADQRIGSGVRLDRIDDYLSTRRSDDESDG